jgi:hypothetical protein
MRERQQNSLWSRASRQKESESVLIVGTPSVTLTLGACHRKDVRLREVENTTHHFVGGTYGSVNTMAFNKNLKEI